eukprot:1506496-Pleurochrysis_carterae.AAC.1
MLPRCTKTAPPSVSHTHSTKAHGSSPSASKVACPSEAIQMAPPLASDVQRSNATPWKTAEPPDTNTAPPPATAAQRRKAP